MSDETLKVLIPALITILGLLGTTYKYYRDTKTQDVKLIEYKAKADYTMSENAYKFAEMSATHHNTQMSRMLNDLEEMNNRISELENDKNTQRLKYDKIIAKLDSLISWVQSIQHRLTEEEKEAFKKLIDKEK